MASRYAGQLRLRGGRISAACRSSISAIRSSPTLVGTYDTPGDACGVAVAGNYAYVADCDAGLQIIDISNPASPTIVGTYDTPGQAYGVAVAGNYAYVADVMTPASRSSISAIRSSPTLVGTYDTPGQASWCRRRRAIYAYVADISAGLQIINISNPASPTLVGTYDTPGYAEWRCRGGQLRLRGGWAAWRSPDHQYQHSVEPDARRGVFRAEQCASSRCHRRLRLCGRRWDPGLQIIDVSTAANPKFVGTLETPNSDRGRRRQRRLLLRSGSSTQASNHRIAPAGVPYRFCVEANNGGINSEAACDNGAIRPSGVRGADLLSCSLSSGERRGGRRQVWTKRFHQWKSCDCGGSLR